MTVKLRIASFPRQLLILQWKNFILLKRNKIATLVELLCPILFIAFLLVIRHFIDRIKFVNNPQFNRPNNIFEFSAALTEQNRNIIAFYPNTQLILNLVQNSVKLIKSFNPKFAPIVLSHNESSIKGLDANTINSLLVFYSFPAESGAKLPDNVRYSIYTQEDPFSRYKVNEIFPQRTDYMFHRAPEDYCHDPIFFNLYNTFNVFKFAMDIQIINRLTGFIIKNPNLLKILQFNCPYYEQDDMIATFAFFYPMLIAIGFLFTVISTIGHIVREKATRMKEYLKLVGIKWYAMMVTWWIRSVIIFVFISLYITIISRVVMAPNTSTVYLFANKAVLNHTSFSVIFLFLCVYSIQVSTFILLFSQLFSKTFNSKVILVVLWGITIVNFYDNLPSSVFKYFFCCLPNLSLNFGVQVIFQYERSGKALDMVSLYENLFDDPLKLGFIMLSMIIWSLIYIPIMWYLENTLPGAYGVRLPYYFPIMPTYWFPKTSVHDFLSKNVDFKSDNSNGFEREPMSCFRSVSLNNLTKTFTSLRKTKTAVRNVSINFYESQITGLLGHNGAGKTTLTYMLCGLYSPTSGNADIHGYNLRFEIEDIRSITGYCPQVDILFDSFNVKEHLQLIALVKGFPRRKLDEEVERIAGFVGLDRDLKKMAKNLSGGMKRRLMVAMALIGDSKIIILDEPTSGLDPFNRVKLWELIRKYKFGRTIILTTHFMEEADALSDRIAIMNHGEIKCCGSPIFLKNYFGNGFRIKILKNARFDMSKFEKIMKEEHIDDYKIEENVAASICLSIPFDKVQILPDFLSDLESQSEELGFDSYSISSSTIEEVFLKVGKINQEEAKKAKENVDFLNVDEKHFNVLKEKFETKEGIFLWIQQIRALFYKRFIIFCRRYVLAFFILFVPFLLEAIFIFLLPESSIIEDDDTRAKTYGQFDLDLEQYGAQDIPFFISSSNPANPFNKLVNIFYRQPSRANLNLFKVNGSIPKFVFDKHNSNLNSLISQYLFGMSWFVSEISNSVNELEIVVYYSKMAYHTVAVIVNEVSNLLLAYLNSNQLNKTIRTFNVPILPTSNLKTSNNFLNYLSCFDIIPMSMFSFLTSIVIGLVISLIVMHVSKEKTTGSKRQQLISNTHPVAYWLSNYLFDYFICFVNIVLIVVSLAIVNQIRDNNKTDVHLITSWPNLAYFVFILLFSSLVWPLYAYCFLSFFKSDIASFVILLVMLGLTPLVDIILSFIQIFTHITDPDVAVDSPVIVLMFSLRIVLCVLFPNITIRRQLYNLRIRSNEFCVDSLNKVLKYNYRENSSFLGFDEPGIGLFVFITVIQFVITILVFIGIEMSALNKEFLANTFHDLFTNSQKYSSRNHSIESDVQREKERINRNDLSVLVPNEPLIVKQLLKLFRKSKVQVAAVDNLNLGVKNHSCFGLLGMNGAGKTTTFRMITGDIDPNRGDVIINGYSIQANKYLARKHLGYCPQFDCLPFYLTVRETIQLFAELRGIDKTISKRLTDDMLFIFQLKEFRNTLVQNLSGGNKRKVSCAIAFIGKPSVVLLDEPSTGMDPGARRLLWNVIKKAKDLGLTILLSSHSMEECEILCDKLTIMLNGQLQCYGTIPHIKKRYGDGYRLIIKCKRNDRIEASVRNVQQFVCTHFATATLEDKQYDTLFYKIDHHVNKEAESVSQETASVEWSTHPKLSNVFALIEKNKESLAIESYSLSQTTLEQVFMSFANKSRSFLEQKEALGVKSLQTNNSEKVFRDDLSLMTDVISLNSSSCRTSSTTRTNGPILLSYRQTPDCPNKEFHF